MKKLSVKALLLNTLLFPGMGHMAVGQAKRGVLILVAVMVGLILLLSWIIKHSVSIIQQAQASGGPMNVDHLSALVRESLANADSTQVTIGAMLIIVGWLAGAIDSFFIKKES